MSEMTTPSEEESHEWEQGWEGHKTAQLRRLAALSFPEKLQWLDDAHELVLRIRRSAESSLSHPPKNEGAHAFPDV